MNVISPKFHATAGWLMVAAVVVLSLIPTTTLPELTPGYDDKLAHGLIYSVLMAWFAVAAARARWQHIAMWIFVLGAGLECCQALVPYRTASTGDVFANSAGIAIGVLLAFALTTGSRRPARAK